MVSRHPLVLLDDHRATPDDAGTARLRLYERPESIISASEPGEVGPALAALDRALARGFHLAGYFSYELGYAFEPRLARLMPPRRSVPLLWFGVFGPPREMAGREGTRWFEDNAQCRVYAGPLRFAETRDTYSPKFRRIAGYIAAGDVYQVNLTFPAAFSFAGDPLALYRRLRPHASAAHGAYVFDGARSILSLSPELFFSIADGVLIARPMKGTAPRGQDAGGDARLRAQLATSEKDRAENLMIVDLIRNDLGRIAQQGRVRVEDLFTVETYPTVHQMVSTVRAEPRPGVTPSQIVRAVFPCGSVTGAPKIRAQEIIREMETGPRGVYCGAVGAFAPDGSAHFNVAIRTLTIDAQAGNGSLGIGGGVVADSREAAEYDECLVKARYYTAQRVPLALIETLRFEPSLGFVREALHLARMARSARALGLPFDAAGAASALREAVEEAGREHAGALRVRLSLDEEGGFEAAATPFVALAPGAVWRYAISARRVASRDALARHKTSWRVAMDEERAMWTRKGCDEVVYLNENGDLAEGSLSNIFAGRDGRLLTPPLDSGALDGCLRRELLDAGECAEARLTPADLALADVVYLGNSLRGLIEAVPFAERVTGAALR